MGLIIEIALTIIAWIRGWKWLALLPAGIGIVVAFLIGLIIGASGGSAKDVLPISMFIDAIIIISLVIMCIFKKKNPAAKSEVKKSE